MTPTMLQKLTALEKKAQEAKTLRKIVEKYPEATIYKDRWNNEYVCAKEVNPHVTDVWFNHNCGCCPDSPLQAWPYLEFEGMKVHSDPTSIYVGEQNDGVCSGERPLPNWEKKFHDNGISDAAIARVQAYLDANPPVNDYDDED